MLKMILSYIISNVLRLSYELKFTSNIDWADYCNFCITFVKFSIWNFKSYFHKNKTSVET